MDCRPVRDLYLKAPQLAECDSQYIQFFSKMLGFYLFACLIAGVFLYRWTRSPLAELPGPFHTKLTAAWLKCKEFSGSRRQFVHDLHTKYGSVVRIGPNEVSFASAEAVKEIYTSGGSGYDKTEFYNLFKQFDTRYDVDVFKDIPHDPWQLRIHKCPGLFSLR